MVVPLTQKHKIIIHFLTLFSESMACYNHLCPVGVLHRDHVDMQPLFSYQPNFLCFSPFFTHLSYYAIRTKKYC